MNPMQDIFTDEDKALAEKIIRHIRREAAKNYSYLEKAIFYLTPEISSEIAYIGANYKKLYYNPHGVTELFSSNPDKLEKGFLHAILHCMLLHPSIGTEENELFDRAADIAVTAMLENQQNSYNPRCRTLMRDFDCSSAVELYNKALTDNKLKKQLNCFDSKKKVDDHSVWRIKESNGQNGNGSDGSGSDGSGSDGGGSDGGADMHTCESDWKQMLSSAEGVCSRLYGTGSGNIFASVKPPDRFSRFSYQEYIRRFAMEEIAEEDPETIDMLLYTTSMEMYDDIPIVEWNEISERCNPSDIIIAVDMSGSCGGEIASNFLRQIYTLFDEMNIKNSVNIHTVFFDTGILAATIIKNRNDADKFISEYTPQGFGGTDFNCVFDYADKFSEKACGRKLKGLFFFSDACGSFPHQKTSYPTTFFVPRTSWISEDYVPEWVELVHYDD